MTNDKNETETETEREREVRLSQERIRETSDRAIAWLQQERDAGRLIGK